MKEVIREEKKEKRKKMFPKTVITNKNTDIY